MSNSRERIVADVRSIAWLGLPLLVNNLSLAGISFADTVMSGQLGARDLAGLAVGVSYFNLYLYIGLGLFMGVSPAVAHAYGADDLARVASYLRQSLWLVIVLAALLVFGLWQASWVLSAIGITPDVLPIAVGYVEVMSFGMPGLLAFFALRFTSEGIGHTRPIMFIAVGSLLFNILGNWVFIYGKWGMPRLGAIGCGVATAISYWGMFAAMLACVRSGRRYRSFAFFARFELPRRRVLLELLRLGAPIAGAVLAEGGLFVTAGLIMGSMGAITVGAHQIALNYASFMFMVPLAISSATTIHVGHLLGSRELRKASFAGMVGIGLCATVMAISALVMVTFNDAIASLYTRDEAVRSLAATLMLMAALFQLSDGIQVGAAGALRGFKDTAVPMVICIGGYWLIGFVIAYTTGVHLGRGPLYVWIGLTAGLTVCAVLLVARYRVVVRRRLVAG